MRTLSATIEPSIFVGKSYVPTKTYVQFAGGNCTNGGIQAPNVGGEELTPINTPSKQTMLNVLGGGAVSHIVTPFCKGGSTTTITVTIDGKVKEYTFEQGVSAPSSKKLMVISFNSLMAGSSNVVVVPSLMSAMCTGQCIRFDEGLKVEYQCDDVNVGASSNGSVLHVFYNAGNTFQYSADTTESVEEY